MNGFGVFFLLKLYIFILLVSRCIISGVKFVLLEMMVKLFRLCVYSMFIVLIIIVMFDVFLFWLYVNCWMGWIVQVCSIDFQFFNCGFFQFLQVWCMLVMLQCVILVSIMLIFDDGVLLVLINRVMCFFGLDILIFSVDGYRLLVSVIVVEFSIDYLCEYCVLCVMI